MISNLQERDPIAAVVGNKSIPTRSLEIRRVAPGIIVDRIEIAALVIGSTVHVFGHQLLVGLNICSGITNGNLAIASASNVLLHIPCRCLHVRSNIGVTGIVDDFVSGQEGESVGVVCKRIDSREDTLEVDTVVRGRGICSVKGV